MKNILEKRFCDESRTRRDRYRELSQGLFKAEDFEELEQLPLFQIWRDHLLAVSMLDAFTDRYDEGIFLFLSPYSNKLCRDGVNRYVEILQKEEGTDSHFNHAWLENYIDTLHTVFDADWTKDMRARYLTGSLAEI